MKKATIFALGLLVALSGSAFSAEQTILFVSGNAWESGGYPPSNAGDEFEAVGVLNDIDEPLIWSTNLYSYTWYTRNLLSLGETVFGNLRFVDYSGGQFTIYVDLLPSNHNYGINPPNATVPSTFTDAPFGVYLDGTFSAFTLSFDTNTQSGSFNGVIDFTGGDVFPLLDDPGGWTFGSQIGAGVAPTGYDSELNGQVFLLTVGVEEQTWGGIKGLYR